LQEAEKDKREYDLRMNEEMEQDDFEIDIHRKQIEYYEERIYFCEKDRNQCEIEYESSDNIVAKQALLDRINKINSQIFLFEKNIMNSNYDMYLLRKKKNKNEPLMLIPYI
jgi:hypothetical protein